MGGSRARGYIYIYIYIYIYTHTHTHTYLQLSHVVVQQKLTQHCEAIMFQLKNKFKKRMTMDDLLKQCSYVKFKNKIKLKKKKKKQCKPRTIE